MARYSSGHNQPLTNWNNLPIYLTTILTAVFVLGLVFSAVVSARDSSLGGWLAFTMPLLPTWSVWRVFTYVFLGQISFFTPFAIACFYWWSVGIETHLGRTVLAKLLALLTLTGPAIAVIWSLATHSPTVCVGNYFFTAGLITAFATLYPNVEVWGWVPFKWFAFACIACGSLMVMADLLQVAQLWGSCAVGFAYIRHARELEYDDYESPLARLQLWFRRRKFRVVKSAAPDSPRRSVRSEAAPAEEMDRLLDKIAKSGMASLTTKERTQLEKAREALLKKERG